MTVRTTTRFLTSDTATGGWQTVVVPEPREGLVRLWFVRSEGEGEGRTLVDGFTPNGEGLCVTTDGDASTDLGTGFVLPISAVRSLVDHPMFAPEPVTVAEVDAPAATWTDTPVEVVARLAASEATIEALREALGVERARVGALVDAGVAWIHPGTAE